MDTKRIAIAIDGSPLSIATMDQMAVMVERLNAHVELIFIEDINLKRLANLNHAKTISPFMPSDHVFGKDEITDLFKSQKIRIKKAIDYAFKGKGIKYTMITKAGSVKEEIIENTKASDLLVMGWTGWKAANYYFSIPYIQGRSHLDFPVINKISLGDRLKAIIKEIDKSVMVLVEPIHKNSPTIFHYDKSEESMVCLDFALNNATTMLGQDIYEYGSDEPLQPINIITNKDSTTSLQDKLKKYNRDANVIVYDTLSLDELKEDIKSTCAKLFICHYNSPLLKNLDEVLVEIGSVPISFLIIK